MTTHILIGAHGYIAGPMTLREAERWRDFLARDAEYLIIQEVHTCRRPVAHAATAALRKLAALCVQGSAPYMPCLSRRETSATPTRRPIMRTAITLASIMILSCSALADGYSSASAKPRKHHKQSQLCKPAVMAAGDAKVTTTWARSEAWKQWRQAVRSAHGEQYMDRGAARAVVVRCTDSGVSGLTKRCTVSAQPCQARAL